MPKRHKGDFAMQRKLEGYVMGVLVGLEAQSLITTRKAKVNVTLEGFEGDRHAGITRLSDARMPHYPRGTEIRNSRQVSLVSFEELEMIATTMGIPTLLPEWLGANLTLRGIPNFTNLPPSTRLFFPQGVVLVVEGENLPCKKPSKVIQNQYPDISNLAVAFPRAALHKRGIVAWVEHPGTIREGDLVTIEVPHQVIYSF
jgi:hypothetical protein